MPRIMSGAMSALTSHFKAWAIFCTVAITVISLAWWDSSDVVTSSLSLIAAITGMMYTLLAGRGKIACYAFGIVNAPLYAYLSFRWGYYGDMTLNLYYFVMMFPGIVCWRRNIRANHGGGIVRTRLCGGERMVWAAAIAVLSVGLWLVLRAIGGNRPVCDALTNVFSVAAMVLTVRRCIEQWVMWIAVDAIEVAMWWRLGDGSIALLAMWALFLVDGLYLFAMWLDDSRSSDGQSH